MIINLDSPKNHVINISTVGIAIYDVICDCKRLKSQNVSNSTLIALIEIHMRTNYLGSENVQAFIDGISV